MTKRRIRAMKLEDMWMLIILVFILCFTASFGQGIFG